MKISYIKYVFFLALTLSIAAETLATEKATYKKIQWVELMPPEDIKALYNPPEELLNIPDGSKEDDISGDVFSTLMQAMDDDYQNALASQKIVESFNKTNVKIPGFVVPVNIEGDKTTEFFIVPYFGACLHYPPPPPNQTIYATYKPGFDLENIYEPYDFSGLLTTSIKESDIATSAYHLKIDQITDYDE